MDMNEFKSKSERERAKYLESASCGTELISQIDRDTQTFFRRYAPTIGGIIVKPLDESNPDEQGFFLTEEDALQAAQKVQDKLNE